MPLRFIHENEEIYVVMCNSHLKFSKSMKIITLKIYTLTVCPLLNIVI